MLTCVWKAAEKVMTIRNGLLAVAMFAVGAVRGEVVLNQLGGGDDFTGSPISDSANFSITWTAGFSGEFDSVSLRIYNTSTVSPITTLALDFSLADDAGVSVTGTNTYGGGVVSDISDYTFDLSALHFSFVSGESRMLFFHLDTATSAGGAVNWSTTDRGVDEFSGWTGGTTPGVDNGQFQLSAVAIPEPMTCGYLAGGAALVCAFKSRRRHAKEGQSFETSRREWREFYQFRRDSREEAESPQFGSSA